MCMFMLRVSCNALAQFDLFFDIGHASSGNGLEQVEWATQMPQFQIRRVRSKEANQPDPEDSPYQHFQTQTSPFVERT